MARTALYSNRTVSYFSTLWQCAAFLPLQFSDWFSFLQRIESNGSFDEMSKLIPMSSIVRNRQPSAVAIIIDCNPKTNLHAILFQFGIKSLKVPPISIAFASRPTQLITTVRFSSAVSSLKLSILLKRNWLTPWWCRRTAKARSE